LQFGHDGADARPKWNERPLPTLSGSVTSNINRHPEG
jgi:hypothetical protein